MEKARIVGVTGQDELYLADLLLRKIMEFELATKNGQYEMSYNLF